MSLLNQFRKPEELKTWVDEIKKIVTKPWRLMEVCGGQTHSIIKHGIDQLLPEEIELIHGPGCPVCVTPTESLDEAIEIAQRPDVIFCTFGDMLRVPGHTGDLMLAKAQGASIEIVYSPIEALKVAEENPGKKVVFFAVGFETTAPANAMTIYMAKREGISNFSVLVSQVMVPPAIEALLSHPEQRIDGFLAAGHVCTIMGFTEYEPLVKKYEVPIVITGFEPLDVVQGVYLCVKQLEEGRREVENQYLRSVERTGNFEAQKMLKEVFQVQDKAWRGMGTIPGSGLGLNEKYAQFDARKVFNLGAEKPVVETECISGEILQGFKKPNECPYFGERCTPERPMGATMVSSEGACSAYYLYREQESAL